MSVAGPMLGGIDCNGTLQIGDAAIRTIQESPLEKDQIQQDDMFIAGYKMYTAYKPPYAPGMDGSRDILRGGAKIANIDGQLTNNNPAPGTYTYGAHLELGGNSSTYNMALVATPPIFPRLMKDDLETLYYHCNFEGTFSPQTDREVLDTSPYAAYDPLFRGDPDDPEVVPDPANFNGWPCPLLITPEPLEMAKLFGEEPDAEFLASNKNVAYAQAISPDPGACGVHDVNRCMALNEVSDNLSDTFWAVVNTAANAIGVPAGALMAVMAHETDFLGGSYDDYLVDDFVVAQWSIPWHGREYHGGSAQCLDTVWSAQGPYQIIDSTYEAFTEPGKEVCQKLNELQPGRCETASKCNFLDASYIAADHLDAEIPCPAYDAGVFLSQMASYAGGTATNDSLLVNVFNACR